jgi:hypothetical protein
MRYSFTTIFAGFLMALILLSTAGLSTANGQAAVIRKPAQEVIEALGRYLSRTGGREITQELAEFGGEIAVRRIAERAVREGGDDALNALVRSARAHGTDALRAADNAVNIPRLLRAVEELPTEMAPQAMRRLSAGTEGRVLAETVEQYGVRALRAEVRHPGIGGGLVRNLGDNGADLANRASRQQAITMSRHAEDIARLPETQRNGVLRLLQTEFDRTLSFMGRFIENNPGKVLFTAATTTVILIHADKVLSGEGEIVIGPDGKAIYVPKPGIIERVADDLFKQVLAVLLPLLAVAGVIWLGIKLWFHYRFAKLKHQMKSAKFAGKLEK